MVDKVIELTSGGHELPQNWLARIALIWSGYAISAFLGSAASYAAIWYVTESTQSALMLSVLYVVAFLPIGLLSPLGGVLADRHNRKVIIIACDAVIALSAFSLALITLLFGPSYAVVMVFCTVFGFASAFRGPAFNATMPLLVPERHLMRINTLDAVLGSVSMIAAPALGIFLYSSLGLQAAIVLDGIGALCAVATMFLARLPRVKSANQDLGPWASIKEGAFALSKARGLLILVIAVSLGMLAYGPIDSLLPLMVKTHFNGDGYAASLLAAVMGAGMLVGSVILMVANLKRNLPMVIVVAAFIVGAGTFAAGLMPSNAFWGFTVCIGVLAIACAWFNAPLMTLLQKGIPEDKLGRVMGLFTALTGLAIPVGTALGGSLAEVIGTPAFFCVDGVFILVLAIALAIPRSVRALNKQG